jgi:hypothetical protein
MFDYYLKHERFISCFCFFIYLFILEHSPKPNVYSLPKATKTDSRKPARANKTTLVSI